MNKFLTSSLLALVFALGTAPVLAWPGNECVNGSCNDNSQRDDTYHGDYIDGNHAGNVGGVGGNAFAHSSDENQSHNKNSVVGATNSNVNSAVNSPTSTMSGGFNGGQATVGDTNASVGDTTSRSNSRVGDTTANVGDTTSRSRSRVGDTTSRSRSNLETGDIGSTSAVRRSGNSRVTNNVDNADTNTLTNRNRVSNEQGQGQDQAQGQKQGQAIVGSGNSRTNVGQGQSMGDQTTSVGDQTTDVVTGDVSTSTSTSTSTDQSQSTNVDGNNSSNVGVEEGGIQIADNSSTVVEAPDIPVSTAAPSFASICTSGSSGQGPNFGFSIAVTSDTCRHLVMADAYMALVRVDAERGDAEGVASNYEAAMEHVEKAAGHADLQGFMGRIRHIVTLGIL